MKLCFPMIDQVCARRCARVTIVLSREKFTCSERDKLFPIFISRFQQNRRSRSKYSRWFFSKDVQINVLLISSDLTTSSLRELTKEPRRNVIIAREIWNPLLCVLARACVCVLTKIKYYMLDIFSQNTLEIGNLKKKLTLKLPSRYNVMNSFNSIKFLLMLLHR